jgi:hypothetical protein
MIERCATPEAWAKYFGLAEAVRISRSTILRRLKEDGAIGMGGRGRLGRTSKNDLFSERDVRKACSHLLENIPLADRTGYIRMGEVRYGTIVVIARSLGISQGVIRSRLENGSVNPIRGKSRSGSPEAFYPESVVRDLCADLMGDLPLSDHSGFIEVDGIRCGTIKAFTMEMGIGEKAISSRIDKASISPVRGKDKSNHVQEFYPEPAIREICADLLGDFLVADDSRFIEIDGIRHGSVWAFSQLFGISAKAIASRLGKAPVASVQAKDQLRRVQKFYPEPAIRSLCADLLGDRPMADKTGFIMKEGERYGTFNSFARLLGIYKKSIATRVGRMGIVPFSGKDQCGNVWDFYPESAVRKACADLLTPLPVADQSGFIEVDGVRYGTRESLARLFGIDNMGIVNRIEKAGLVPVKGRAKSGGIRDFYSEPAMRSLCADFLADLPKADESGFIEVGGIRYGILTALEDSMGVSDHTLSRKIKSASLAPVRGRVQDGRVFDFYPETMVHELCAELLASLPVADELGYFEKNGIRHGTILSIADALGISRRVIRIRLRENAVGPIRGKDRRGTVRDFYSEPQVRELCADLLALLPVTDGDGFVEVDGIRHGILSAFTQSWGFCGRTLVARIAKSGIIPIRGKDKSGRPADFYPEPAVREACRDLIEKKQSKSVSR